MGSIGGTGATGGLATNGARAEQRRPCFGPRARCSRSLNCGKTLSKFRTTLRPLENHALPNQAVWIPLKAMERPAQERSLRPFPLEAAGRDMNPTSHFLSALLIP